MNFWNWLKSLFKPKPITAGDIVENKEKKTPKWFLYAKTFSGKKETDSKFAAFMIPFWKKLFGRSIGTIGAGGAWCGLAVAVALAGAGYDWQKNGEMARNWKNYGQEINWKQDGIPQGAVVQVNHSFNCSSGSNNHVSMANGDCSPADLAKSGATIDLYGGNQGNTWKVSTYSVREICAVRWPKEESKPSKIDKSNGCSSGSRDNESTR